MVHDCSSCKRRKILHANHPESNKNPNLLSPIEASNNSLAFVDESHATCSPTEISSTQVLVNQNDALSDYFDLDKESDDSKNKIVMEESGTQVRNEDDGHSHSRNKLLVLDVNGLLVDILADSDEACKPDSIIGSKSVFKRPFCDEFLKFCFERFSVGVWTSRTRWNIKRVIDFLMRDTQHQLLFCWDQSHCTDTGFNTIENNGKPLLLKELKKLWEKQDPNLPWDRGVFNESNTLLLDDSPYKALLNPPYTAIFPYTYSYRNAQDNGLGPNGDLRNYLELLAASDNVQKFIEQNPFGQQPITHDNESWNFYHKIICSTQSRAGPCRSRKKLIVIDIGGLLIDVVTAPREGFGADTMLGSRAVFKRPYCDDFLQFCFKKFNVGVWTSTTRYNMERALDFLMRDTQHKLLFCWDLSHCTDTGFNTVENNCKRLLLKELRKLWEKKDPNIPWELGEYDESNTLLVENAPHRALLNPPHTAIFPYPYRYWNTEDNLLGPEGDLRIYLERLAASENVQKFVSENLYGQRPIREKNLSWKYYQKVIRAFSSKRKTGDSVDAQCINSSEPKPDIGIASVTKTLSEPKTDSSTALAAPMLLEPKPRSPTTSAAQTLVEPKTATATALVGQTLSDLDTTAVAAQTSMEPETITATILTAPNLLEPEIGTTPLVGQTLSEPETITTTILTAPTLLEPEIGVSALVGQTLLEPETITTTILTAPTLLEPEIGTTALVGQTLSEPESRTTTILTAPTLLEPEIGTTALVGQTLSEPDLDSTALAAQTSVEPETITATILTAPTLLEPEIGTTTALVGQTLSEPDLDNTALAAQTSLEPKTTTTTILTAPNLLEPETGTTAMVGQTLSEPNLNCTALVAQTSLEPETITTTILTALTVLEQETGINTALVGQTLLEPEIDNTARAAPTLLEPETDTTTALVGQILSEPEIDTTASAAQSLLEPETLFVLIFETLKRFGYVMRCSYDAYVYSFVSAI